MKVVICGAGLVGHNIAKHLIAEKNDVTVIDKDPELIANINETLDCRGLLGHASSPSVLEKAGIADADIIIAVTLVDEVNMMACQVAHTLFNVPRKLARIREQSYLLPQWRVMFSNDSLPIDVIISPEREVAEAIVSRVNSYGAFDVMPMESENVIMLGVVVKQDSIILNDTVSKVLSLSKYEELKMNIMTINRKDRVFLPNVDTVLEPNDEVYLICDKTQVKYCLALFGYEEPENERFVIVGGGNIGSFLVEKFENENVIVIEKDATQSRKVAEKFPNIVVLNGNSLDSNVLEEANINENDICISVTNDDETNLLTSLLAKNIGINRIIGLANNPAYNDLIKKLNVDMLVNPRNITASVILKNIRCGVIKSLYKLYDNKINILEVNVAKESELLGIAITEINLPKKCYLGMIVRNNELMDITGDIKFEIDDRVILATEMSNYKKIVDMFTPLQEFY